jgi:hypothetical protein
MTPTAEAPAGLSTEKPPKPKFIPAPQVGDIVLLQIAPEVFRPLTVVTVTDRLLVSGVVSCDPGDHAEPAFRRAFDRVDSPARIFGRPDRACPVGYAEFIAHGTLVGQWRPK